MSNVPHMLETALLLLCAYLLGCLLGYAVRRILFAARGTRQVAPASAPAAVAAPVVEARRVPTSAARLAAAASDDPAPAPVVAVARLAKARAATRPAPKPKRLPADPRPPVLAAPRGGQADNLKQIKGIGPKIEASLNAIGIYHLDQIAAWTRANIDWVDAHLAFKGRIQREQWVEQAIELAKVRA